MPSKKGQGDPGRRGGRKLDARKKALTAGETQVVLRARLADWPYPVWRDIAIRGDAAFFDLHNKLQQVFVWYDDHAHLFEFRDEKGRRRYVSQGLWEEDPGPDEVESSARLRSEKFTVGQKFTYEYDMGDSIEVELEIREVSPLDEGTLPRPVKARTLALRGHAPEQYAYRGDPRRYSEEVRKALERGKPPVVEVTLEDELKALAMWSDYDSPWRSYWEGRPTQQEILRDYQDTNLGRKPHNNEG
jgi:Plasmid pRiA4b ORF-3-like protein